MSATVERFAPVGSLPSPPDSPSMSRNPPTSDDSRQDYAGLTLRPSRYPTSHKIGTNTSFPVHGSLHTLSDYPLSSQSQGTYQHHGSPRDFSSDHRQIPVVDASGTWARNRQETHLLSPDSATGFPKGTDTLAYYRSSGETSPASQHTPEFMLTRPETQSDEEEEIPSTGSDEDEIVTGAEKSGAERLAEKRKMKRFRLTHAQTRYLMSEFARQAHPDAGQRERLSRDIPGLSPRQVQVWFQNRRAKLKRLTSDDQERMMRSRKLPEDFDFSRTLQPAYDERRPSLGSVASLTNLSLSDAGRRRPALTLDQTIPPPTSMASVYTNLSPKDGSVAGSSNNLSPVSSINEGSQYSGSYYSASGSPAPQFTNPFNRSNSLSASSNAQRQADMSRTRMRAESLASPMTQSSSTFAGNAYGCDFRTSSENQDVGRTPSSRNLPQSRNPLYDQIPAQYNSAAGSAGYSYSLGYSGGEAEVNSWQNGQVMTERLIRDGQLSRSSQPQIISQHPAPSPYNYGQSTMYDTSPSQADPRFFPGPEIQSYAATIEGSRHAAQSGSGPGRRRGGTYPVYHNPQQ